jgi:transposase
MAIREVTVRAEGEGMGQTFEPYDPDQGLLLPPSLRDWLPEGHLAHFVSDTVDQLDLRPFLAKFERREDGRGSLAYHPAMMLKVLIYAYSTGVFSSRRIESALSDSVALRYLAADNRPGHRTIARFRAEHIEHFQAVFVQIVRIAQEAGLVKLGTLVIDGSKLKANASKHKAMSYGRMKEEERKLRDEIRDITDRARGIDEAEDRQFGPDFRGDELPKELIRRQDRIAKIREAKRRLEEQQQKDDEESGRGERMAKEGRGNMKRPNGVPPDKAQTNFTDPESRIMKTGSGAFEQCYNAQIAVDAEARVIVAADVTQCAADSGELVKMVELARRNCRAKPGRVLADSGYKSENNFHQLERRGIDAYVALGRAESSTTSTTEKSLTLRMWRKLRTRRGRTRYKLRKSVVEPVFGWIKQVLGFRGFLVRGVRKVRGEWALVCLALNVKQMSQRLGWV